MCVPAGGAHCDSRKAWGRRTSTVDSPAPCSGSQSTHPGAPIFRAASVTLGTLKCNGPQQIRDCGSLRAKLLQGGSRLCAVGTVPRDYRVQLGRGHSEGWLDSVSFRCGTLLHGLIFLLVMSTQKVHFSSLTPPTLQDPPC